MIRFNPRQSLAFTSALFAAGAAFSSPEATDYSKLLPGASSEAKVLRTATISFMDALQRARAAGSGEVIVMNALIDGETVKYEALVQSDGIARRILINAKTGEATAPNVPLHTAIKTALETVQGTLASCSLDLIAEPPSIRVVILANDLRNDMRINAVTGAFMSNEITGSMPGIETENPTQTTESGLQFIDMVVGEGAKPAGPSSVVLVHYTGYLVDGTKFDSSVDRGDPITFPLNRVIAGWTEGVGSMNIGGKRKLIIPWEMAYGAGGRPPTIPPKAMLVFDVELIESDGEGVGGDAGEG